MEVAVFKTRTAFQHEIDTSTDTETSIPWNKKLGQKKKNNNQKKTQINHKSSKLERTNTEILC